MVQFFNLFIISSEKCQKVHQSFFIFLETSTRSRVVGSGRRQERAGGLKQVRCFDFLSSVSTRFLISFPIHHCFFPNFDTISFLVVLKMCWVFEFVLNCPEELERGGWGRGSPFSRATFYFFFRQKEEMIEKVGILGIENNIAADRSLRRS